MIPLLSMSHKKVSTSGRNPERPFMRDTTLAKTVARVAASERAELAVTSPAAPSLLLLTSLGESSMEGKGNQEEGIGRNSAAKTRYRYGTKNAVVAAAAMINDDECVILLLYDTMITPYFVLVLEYNNMQRM